MVQTSLPSIESKSSWQVAAAAVVVLSCSFGAPWITAVALKAIAAEMGGARSYPALAVSLAWFGGAIGGIGMGRIADRIGIRWTVMFGATMIAVGLVLSSFGPGWQLYVGHGLFIGLIGIGGINAPLYVYVTRWFDRRRGSALALISSGTYIAGAIWPPIFERLIAYGGWRQTMLWFAAIQIVVILPLAVIYLRPAPELVSADPPAGRSAGRAEVLGWPANRVFVLMCAAIFLCCVTMSMPQQHLVALCSDLGIAPAHGAVMLSFLLGTGVLARQVWGLISDRIGGLTTVLVGSTSQALAVAAFVLTQDEAGLFAVSAAFGLAFAGLVPAYVLAARELFPASEASWRIPVLFLCSGSGMATGGWLAGVIYDHFGFYGPAFATGVGFNLVNLLVIGTLVGRQTLVGARA